MRERLLEEEATRRVAVDEAVTEGLRALGSKFDQAGQRSMLESLPIGQVNRLRDSWRAIADGKPGAAHSA